MEHATDQPPTHHQVLCLHECRIPVTCVFRPPCFLKSTQPHGRFMNYHQCCISLPQIAGDLHLPYPTIKTGGVYSIDRFNYREAESLPDLSPHLGGCSISTRMSVMRLLPSISLGCRIMKRFERFILASFISCAYF